MRFRKIVVPTLLALALITGTITVATAQEEPTLSDLHLDGLEKMYGRAFAADIGAMMESASPDAMPSGWWLLTTLVLEFDSDDTARAGVDTLREQGASASEAGGAVTMEDVELDLGDLNYSAQLTESEEGGVTTSLLIVTVQDGPNVYAVTGLAFGENPAPLVESVMQSMLDAEISDDEEVFHEDGTSTGGLWAKLPGVEAITSRARALTVAADTMYFPMREATPAA